MGNVKYKWTCENCNQTIITSGTRTPDADGCPEGYVKESCGELITIHKHIWHGEEIDAPEKKSNRK